MDPVYQSESSFDFSSAYCSVDSCLDSINDINKNESNNKRRSTNYSKTASFLLYEMDKILEVVTDNKEESTRTPFTSSPYITPDALLSDVTPNDDNSNLLNCAYKTDLINHHTTLSDIDELSQNPYNNENTTTTTIIKVDPLDDLKSPESNLEAFTPNTQYGTLLSPESPQNYDALTPRTPKNGDEPFTPTPRSSISEYAFTPSSSSSVPLMELLYSVEDVGQDVLFAKYGYQKVKALCDTLQGQLYKARVIKNKNMLQPSIKPDAYLSSNNNKDTFVIIKKCEKHVFKQQIAVEEKMNFLVSENIVKEAMILRYITVDNHCLGNHIIKYINFFQSDEAYYLVMEYIDSHLNLRQFVDICFRYIEDGKLKLKHYQKIIKCIYWQLAVTMRWLHHDMNCCHLDLCLENIMLTNCTFLKGENDEITINPDISIRLGDFGVAEVFDNEKFECKKGRLSIDNEAQSAPEVLYQRGPYNAKKADVWSLGMILFQCMTGQPLYDHGDVDKAAEFAWNVPDDCKEDEISQSHPFLVNAYWSVSHNKLREYLTKYDLSKYFKTNSISMLCHLLDIDASTRYDTDDIIKDKWFNLYYQTHNKRIWKKSIFQIQASLKQITKMATFPYYGHEFPMDAQK